jgi:hypothetical protein
LTSVAVLAIAALATRLVPQVAAQPVASCDLEMCLVALLQLKLIITIHCWQPNAPAERD